MIDAPSYLAVSSTQSCEAQAVQRFYRRLPQACPPTRSLPACNPCPHTALGSRLQPSTSTFNPRFACFHARLPDAVKRWRPRSQVVICHVADRIRKPFVRKMSERWVQPATCNLQPATFNLQRSTCNLQRSTCNLRPATCDLHLAPFPLSFCATLAYLNVIKYTSHIPLLMVNRWF
jgi:hypothetical protein